jgi:hypothetical protein
VEVRRVNVSDEAGLEAGAKPQVQGRKVMGAAVAGECDLTAGGVKLVEGVVKLDLGLVLALKELDVVQEEDIRTAIAAAELFGAVVSHGCHELTGELLGGDTDYSQVGTYSLVSDGMEEMGLPQAGGSGDKEGVVGVAGGAGDGHGGGVGQAVAASDHKGVEGEGGVETGLRPAGLGGSG